MAEAMRERDEIRCLNWRFVPVFGFIAYFWMAEYSGQKRYRKQGRIFAVIAAVSFLLSSPGWESIVSVFLRAQLTNTRPGQVLTISAQNLARLGNVIHTLHLVAIFTLVALWIVIAVNVSMQKKDYLAACGIGKIAAAAASPAASAASAPSDSRDEKKGLQFTKNTRSNEKHTRALDAEFVPAAKSEDLAGTDVGDTSTGSAAAVETAEGAVTAESSESPDDAEKTGAAVSETDIAASEIPEPAEISRPAGKIPAAELPEVGASQTTGRGRLDINTATQSELMTLPGVDAATALKAIGHREKSGGFASAQEFIDLYRIKPHFAVQILDLAEAVQTGAAVQASGSSAEDDAAGGSQRTDAGAHETGDSEEATGTRPAEQKKIRRAIDF